MIARALIDVFKDWIYVLIATVVASLVFILSTWLPNLGLIWQITVSPSVPFLDKASILISLIGSIGTNFSVFSAFYTTAIAVMFGMNAAMVAYHLRQRIRFGRQPGHAGTAAGIGGLASGFVGIGCAACGTFVLGPILSFVGAAGLVALLPFGGQEFGLIGVGILGFSIFLIARKIGEPLICPVVLQDGGPTGEKGDPPNVMHKA